MPRQKLSPKTLLARQREKQAFDLRLAGAHFEDIANQLGYRWASSARAAVMRFLKRLAPPPEAKKMRQLQVERLGRLLLAVWGPATRPRPDLQAQQRVLGILKEISALLGLYLPREIKADITVTETNLLEGASIGHLHEITRAIGELRAYGEKDLEFLADVQKKLLRSLPGGGEEHPHPDGGNEAGD